MRERRKRGVRTGGLWLLGVGFALAGEPEGLGGGRRERLDFSAQAGMLPRLPSESPAGPAPGSPDPAFRDAPVAARVLAVSPEARFVALDAGAEHGVRAGFAYQVFRGNRWIARVRVREVRGRICGAVVEQAGAAPLPGDRAALAGNG